MTNNSSSLLVCSNDIEGNTRELICLNHNCGHKFGWHHAKPNKLSDRVCYGLACTCSGFNDSGVFCRLNSLLERVFGKQSGDSV